MNKVITINLNGRAYQLEEDGYQVLQEYLKNAEQKLNDDPDKKEILADLEQAISEKLERFLRAGKNVVVKSEIEIALKEMGPVEGGESTDQKSASQPSQQPPHKRFYRIREGAMLGGVCTGIAAYFNIDITLVRIICVILAILTHVAWFLIYIIVWIVTPSAETEKQMAEAYGAPFTAQEWIDRARNEYHKFTESGKWKENKQEWKKWKDQLKQQHKEHKRAMKQQYRQMRYQYHYNHSPLFGILTAIISILWVVGLVTLVSSGMIFGILIPTSIPLWISILGWVAIYGIVMSPIKAARWASYQSPDGQQHHHHDSSFLEGIAWLAMIVIIFWAIYQYVPSSHQYYDKVGLWFQHVWDRITNR